VLAKTDVEIFHQEAALVRKQSKRDDLEAGSASVNFQFTPCQRVQKHSFYSAFHNPLLSSAHCFFVFEWRETSRFIYNP